MYMCIYLYLREQLNSWSLDFSTTELFRKDAVKYAVN